MKIIKRQAEHHRAIENLLDESFGQDRHQRISYAIREGTAYIEDLSYVIFEDQHLIATISAWPIILSPIRGISEQQSIKLVMVGPIAVSQSYQNLGFGRQLVNTIIEIARHENLGALMMIGDPEYYAQFGFAAMDGCDWQLPGPYEKHRLLIHSDGANKLPTTGILGPNIAPKMARAATKANH